MTAKNTPSPSKKYLNLRVAAKVTDAAALLRHARALWEENGGALAGAPRTVEEAIVVAMVTHADGTPPAEFGLAVQGRCTTAPSVFEKVNAEASAEVLAAERRRFVAGEERDIKVEIGADYLHRATVTVRASSLAEAERAALARLGDTELKLAEQVEFSAFAQALA